MFSCYYIPKSVHASFSDAAHWLPGIVGRKMGLRGPGEKKHDTIRMAAQACARHFLWKQKQQSTLTAGRRNNDKYEKEQIPVQVHDEHDDDHDTVMTRIIGLQKSPIGQ